MQKTAARYRASESTTLRREGPPISRYGILALPDDLHLSGTHDTAWGRNQMWLGRPARVLRQDTAAANHHATWASFDRLLRKGRLLILVLLSVVCLATARSQAQPSAARDAAELSPTEQLALAQSRIADNYARLEQLMIRRAEAESANNPQRAALLKQAVQQSATRLTRGQLNSVADLLKPPAQMNRAIDQQQQALQDLNDLLQLLLSENRSDRQKDEQARIREYIKELERIRRLERGLQGRTEGGADLQRLQDEQDRVASRTGDLAKDIQQDQQSNSPESDSEENARAGTGQQDEPGDQDDKEKSPNQGELEQGEPEQGEPGDVDDPSPDSPPNKPPPNGQQQEGSGKTPSGQNQSPPKDPDNSPPQDGSPQGSGQPSQDQGQPSEQGNPQDSAESEPQNQTPESQARQGIEAAEQHMREAQKRLDKAKREEAIAEQEQALRELEKAKAALEEILRQLREEELERTLALLESRFRRMLRSQLKIYESTKRINGIATEERRREVDIQASKLSFEESKLVAEADRALNLLREEGSSVAFPETVEQMRDEMIHVSDRLSVVQVGVITQAAEEEIIAALEELIAALQQAQKDLEEQQQQPQQMQTPSDPGDRPLVDQLAELKMIRSLQMRVNKRTQRFAQLLKHIDDPVGQFFGEDLLRQLQRLSETQLRIQRVTHDIVVGKNR